MNFGSIFIEKTDNNYSFKKNDSSLFPIFIESLQLPFETHFYANTIFSLKDFIISNNFSIYTAEKLLISLYNQLHILNQYSLSISYLDLSDILVIDNNQFFICNLNKFYKIDHMDNILISEIYDKNNSYLSPLYKNNNSIPFLSHKNDFFFNLALIVLDCFRKTNYLLANLSNEDILDNYKYTKVYQTLKLCLQPDISNRLFIIF
jgi:hypothetical protein